MATHQNGTPGGYDPDHVSVVGSQFDDPFAQSDDDTLKRVAASGLHVVTHFDPPPEVVGWHPVLSLHAGTLFLEGEVTPRRVPTNSSVVEGLLPGSIHGAPVVVVSPKIAMVNAGASVMEDLKRHLDLAQRKGAAAVRGLVGAATAASASGTVIFTGITGYGVPRILTAEAMVATENMAINAYLRRCLSQDGREVQPIPPAIPDPTGSSPLRSWAGLKFSSNAVVSEGERLAWPRLFSFRGFSMGFLYRHHQQSPIPTEADRDAEEEGEEVDWVPLAVTLASGKAVVPPERIADAGATILTRDFFSARPGPHDNENRGKGNPDDQKLQQRLAESHLLDRDEG